MSGQGPAYIPTNMAANSGRHATRPSARSVEREVAAEFADFALGDDELVIVGAGGGEDGIDQPGGQAHFGLLEAARGQGGRTDADAGSFGGGELVEGDEVLVDDDAGGFEGFFGPVA